MACGVGPAAGPCESRAAVSCALWGFGDTVKGTAPLEVPEPQEPDSAGGWTWRPEALGASSLRKRRDGEERWFAEALEARVWDQQRGRPPPRGLGGPACDTARDRQVIGVFLWARLQLGCLSPCCGARGCDCGSGTLGRRQGSRCGVRGPLGPEWISTADASGTWPSHRAGTLPWHRVSWLLGSRAPGLGGRWGLCPFLLRAEPWPPGPASRADPLT